MPGDQGMRIGVHASHELYGPARLLAFVQRAERLGISCGMCSDHFHPWSERESASGFAWSWLGSALQATTMSFGTVCAPGQRYHPAIIAQAVATLCDLYPGRFWLAVGSGENLNEAMTGDPWPQKVDRNHRLVRSVEIMRALWRGETVSHAGAINVSAAKLFTLPKSKPYVFGAAITPETAGWLASWADGLVTCGHEIDSIREIVDSFREGGGEGKPLKVQVAISHSKTRATALDAVYRRWRHCGLQAGQLSDLPTPRHFDDETAQLTLRDVDGKVLCTTSRSEVEDFVGELKSVGFAEVYFHDLSDDLDVLLELLAHMNIP